MATYLNKIKILDDKNQISPKSDFGFGIGTLREDTNGNIVYGPESDKKVFLAADENGSYTLDDTVLQEYMDQRDTFLKKVEYKDGYLIFTFQLSAEDEEKIQTVEVPVKDFAIDSDNIYFTENLIYTADIGVLTLEGEGYKTLESKGKTLEEVMSMILKKTVEPTIKRYPNASLTASCNNTGASLEIGSYITSVSYTGSLSEDGDYETNGKETASGIKSSDLSWKVTLGDDATTEKTTSTGSYITDIRINSTDKDVVYATVKATATLNLKNVITPTNNLGEPNADIKIKGFDDKGTIVKNLTAEVKASGYRNTWYYVGTDYTSTLDSAFFRTKRDGLKAMNKFTTSFGTVTIPRGTKRVAFAVLGDKTLQSVIDVDGQNLDVKANFTKKIIPIEGANGFDEANYSVFYFENSNGIAATKYTVTIS